MNVIIGLFFFFWWSIKSKQGIMGNNFPLFFNQPFLNSSSSSTFKNVSGIFVKEIGVN